MRKTGSPGTATDTIAYTYDSTWKDQLASYDGEYVFFNEIGDPWAYTHYRDFVWSARELRYVYLEDGGFAEYRYNENGLRSLKTIYDENNVPNYYYYFWSDDGRLLAYTVDQSGSNDLYSVLVLYNSDKEPIGFTVGEDTYYYLKNIQGDVLCVTDAEGTPVVNYTYDAWGAMTVSPASQNVPSATVVNVAFLNPVTYRGYFYDYELGLYYLQSRYYDPETGRFISADAYCDTGTGIIGANVFTYCNNNSSNLIDADGYSPYSFVISDSEPSVPPLQEKDDTVYTGMRVTRTIRRLWDLSGQAAKAFKKQWPDGIAFYEHFRSGNGKDYYYDYKKAYNTDSGIEKTVSEIISEMRCVVELKYDSGNLIDGQYISLKSNANVYPSTVNWRLAIGYHAFWIRAKFSYLSKTDRLKLDYYMQATDRYNFDRNASGVKRVINIYNGVFVKSGLAKHFNSYGIIQEAHQWNRGTYI